MESKMARKMQRNLKATYVIHADGWTVRPTVKKVRYFLGYWPSEEDALAMAERFKARVRYENAEQAQVSAEEAREVSRDAMADHRASKPKAPKLPPDKERLTALENKVAFLLDEIKTLAHQVSNIEGVQ